MKSMTGFGSASVASSGVELEINIRAVNGRFLEMRLHLPREYASLESNLKKQLSTVFQRGTIDVYVSRKLKAQAQTKVVSVQHELAAEYLKGLKKLRTTLKLKGEVSLDTLVRLPDVVRVEDQTGLTPSEKALAEKAFKKAAQACDEERLREGESLHRELTKLLQQLEKTVNTLSSLRAAANEELEKRFKDRLVKLGFDGEVDPQRLAQEIIMQIDRTDINEELARLAEHVGAYRQLLKSDEPQGKKMDFYAQELLREVNTIGSKSHVAKLTSLVVEAKTVVERIREQVQNVE